MLFENQEEAEFRLSEGVVLWNGLLFYPRIIGYHDGEIIYWGVRVGSDGVLDRDLRSLVADQIVEGTPYLCENKWLLGAKLTDPGFNEFEPFPIGYVYYQGMPTYCQRMPTRMTTQSLTPHALVFSRLRLSLSEEPFFQHPGGSFNFDILRPAIEGEDFCPIDQIGATLSSQRELVAISHEVAVMRASSTEGLVFFEGIAVGSISLDGPPDIVMKPDLAFLKSELMPCGFGIKD